MQRLNIFFQDHVFHHRIAFKRLHKGLQPFTNINLHKKDVWSLGDVQWGLVYPKPLQIDIQQNNTNQTLCITK